MKILFVTSEVAGLAATGGLGDVAFALPRALASMGHSVDVFIPYYRAVRAKLPDCQTALAPLDIFGNDGRALSGRILSASWSNLNLLFVERDEFFDRSHLYGSPVKAYDDNLERFVFFQKAALVWLAASKTPYDVVHAHDWPTALLPAYLKAQRPGREKSVMTIHNLAYQGLFSAAEFQRAHLPAPFFQLHTGEFYGQFNCLKAGIQTADAITTVSPTYAQEIQTPELGCGLDGVLRVRSRFLTGILNGVDDEVWNPATDPHLAATYDSSDMEGKKTCRNALLKEFSLKAGPRDVVIGLVARLTEQKGIDLVSLAIPQILELPVRLVVLGSGETHFEEQCRAWQNQYPDKVAVHIGFDNAMAHRIEAGADVFLMPSRFEPCGLNQMYSLRYGTPPLVNPTGGLADTVEPIRMEEDIEGASQGGTGFHLTSYTPESLVEQLAWILRLFQRPALWRAIQRRGMSRRFDWSVSSAAYEKLYQSLLTNKP